MKNAVEWSDELDALRFSVPGHGAPCAMHRLAFKALLRQEPEKAACLQFFESNSPAFLTAAAAKIARLALPVDRSLHLNSRDLRRAMTSDDTQGPARACRILDRS
ncbi:hypothetical protein [Agrobacterium bohemicum]|uniref:Uncharacterized protein n=1 Tax=Agrobacterium bohemicum TaxID=2052828 RepID=A0A135P9E2_9HYPH|nr:hypothetical protein [Agrobacterium bohemicum]KXG88036.1 hypothetical protein ATO67_16735 [Agrobacterium bohemicum]